MPCPWFVVRCTLFPPNQPSGLIPTSGPAENSGVKHITLQADDVPVAPFLMDRRRQPDRRASWRGGRRDSDWRHRPPGVWQRVPDTTQPPARWRQVLASLHLW